MRQKRVSEIRARVATLEHWVLYWERFAVFFRLRILRLRIDFCVLLLTDLLENNSHAIVVGEKKLFDQAFGHQKIGEDYFLKSVVSRKRQVVPKLEERF